MRADQQETAVRLDKWLWAARFFKTRSLAKQAVDGGKVQVGGNRAKAARPLHRGDQLRIRRGEVSIEVTVLELSSRRGPAPVAQTLYQESADSIEARRQSQERARLERLAGGEPAARPSKQQRRKIKQFTSRD